MSDSENGSKSSHRSRKSSRSDEMLKIIKEMKEDQERRDQQQKEFQEVVGSSIREQKEFQEVVSSSIRELKEEIQEKKSKSSSSSRKSESKIPEEVGPVVELESMIESDDELVRGILSSEINLGLALSAIKTISSIEPAALAPELESAEADQLISSLNDVFELPAGVTDRRSSRSSIQMEKAILLSPTLQSNDLLDPEIASLDWRLPERAKFEVQAPQSSVSQPSLMNAATIPSETQFSIFSMPSSSGTSASDPTYGGYLADRPKSIRTSHKG